MPHPGPVNWQPISAMPLVARMIDGALDDTREHIATLTEALTRPHVLDDATIDRIERAHTEQLEFVDIYVQQIRRWRTPSPSTIETRELDRMAEQNRQLRAVTEGVLALARELRKGVIDRIRRMSDIELGLQGSRQELCVPVRHRRTNRQLGVGIPYLPWDSISSSQRETSDGQHGNPPRSADRLPRADGAAIAEIDG